MQKNKLKILIFYKKESSYLRRRIRRVSTNLDLTVITPQDIYAETYSFDNQAIKVESIKDYINSNLTKKETIVDFIRNITQKVFANQSIGSSFIFEKINTWWFLPNLINALVRDNEFLIYTNAIRNILTKYKPDLVLFDRNSKKAEFIRTICKDNGIKCKTNNKPIRNLMQKFYRFFVIVFAGLKRRRDTNRIARWAKNETKKYLLPKSSHPKIAFISHSRFIRKDYAIDRKLEQHEMYQKNIQLELVKMGEFDIYSLELLSKPKEMNIYSEFHKYSTKIKRIPIQNFMTKDLLRNSMKTRRLVTKKLKDLFNKDTFKQLFSFEGVSLIDIFSFQLFRRFITEITSSIENVNLFKKALTEIQPEIVILHNEQSSFGRALVIASKNMRIPTLAIQHGMINFSSIGYLQAKEMICSENNKISNEYCLQLPTITSVYSESTKNFLIEEGNYPINSLVVNGCSRWDVILDKSCFNKSEFLEKYNFSSEKKVLVVLSPGLFVKPRQQFFNKEILEAIQQNFPEMQVIWRPHPDENDKELKILTKTYKIEKILIDKTLPLYDVLNACDMAVTVHSTTGLEAMLFDKPVITLIPPGEEENELFKNTGAVLKVENRNELINAIKLLQTDKKIKNLLKENRLKLIDRLVLFDGMASERNAKLIFRMISKKLK